MPQMADMTVKKNDGTTDVTYTAVQPAAGDKSPAIWRNESVGTAASHRPTFTCQSRYNGNNTARKIDANLTYPTTYVGADGRTYVGDKGLLHMDGTLPVNMDVTSINELVAQAANLLKHALMQSAFKSGFAPS
jgi:hypothetical protein